MVLLLAESIFKVKAVKPKLIWSNYIAVIRDTPCHPVMASYTFKPPDFIFILKSYGIHLVGSILFKETAKSYYTISGAFDVWKNYGYYIFFTYATDFLRGII